MAKVPSLGRVAVRHSATLTALSVVGLLLGMQSAMLAAETEWQQDRWGNINQRSIGVGQSRSHSDVPRPEPTERHQHPGPFDSIHLHSSLQLSWRRAPQWSMHIRADAETLEAIRTRNVSGTLHIEHDGQNQNLPIQIELTGPQLQRLVVDSDSEVTARDIAAETFRLKATRMATIVLQGRSDRCLLVSQGMTDIDQAAFQCRKLEVQVQGTSDLVVNVSQSLSGKLSGMGDLTVLGGAQAGQLIRSEMFDVTLETDW